MRPALVAPWRVAALLPLLLLLLLVAGCRSAPLLERVRVNAAGDGFVLEPSGRAFVPWGFNYDHDRDQRLLEDYWEENWSDVVEDFREMKALGANVVRIHLQVGKLLRGPAEVDAASCERLRELLSLAESLRLYLDITGLGCYRKSDVPPWYDALDEAGRWEAQVRFWRAVAAAGAGSSAVFCYDLMNEPVVPGGKREPGEWLGPPFAGLYHYVQFVTLDPGERPRPEVAARWIDRLASAIREVDPGRLITVGLVDWSLDRPGLTSGFVPSAVAPALDFLAVHLYPESGKLQDALETLRGFRAGKPIVIEETFPLRSSLEEFRELITASSAYASGWIGFYWGKTPEECRRSDELADKLVLGWLELFQAEAPRRRRP